MSEPVRQAGTQGRAVAALFPAIVPAPCPAHGRPSGEIGTPARLPNVAHGRRTRATVDRDRQEERTRQTTAASDRQRRAVAALFPAIVPAPVTVPHPSPSEPVTVPHPSPVRQSVRRDRNGRRWRDRNGEPLPPVALSGSWQTVRQTVARSERPHRCHGARLPDRLPRQAGTPQGERQRARERGGRSERARTRPAHGNATAGGCRCAHGRPSGEIGHGAPCPQLSADVRRCPHLSADVRSCPHLSAVVRACPQVRHTIHTVPFRTVPFQFKELYTVPFPYRMR